MYYSDCNILKTIFFTLYFILFPYLEPAEMHMGTGTLVRAAPHKMPVPTCSVLNSYFLIFETEFSLRLKVNQISILSQSSAN